MLATSFGLHAGYDAPDPGNSNIESIVGITGPAFSLTAKEAQITTPDGDAFRIWGFANGTGEAQYPGPTLIVNEGDCVVITLNNADVPADVSLVFPGQESLSAGCTDGDGFHVGVPSTDDGVVAEDGASITYAFTATNPGTYIYHSGVSPQIQIDMGLVGALIVRPDMAGAAYNDERTAYDREYLYMMSEMDPRLHYMADNDSTDQWDNSTYNSVLWFLNGRNFPDTLIGDNIPLLPHQPYGSLYVMVPGERILVRFINVGRNQRPPHLHGNHYNQIARDGNLIKTAEDATADIVGIIDYTLNTYPLSTADVIFEWDGRGMGWDIYGTEDGHTCTDDSGDGFDDTSHEWCASHGVEMPVIIPENQDLAFGAVYSGSPLLGQTDSMPIGEGGLNPFGAYIHIWHSHSERELANNDIFPGGIITFMVILAPALPY